MFDENSVSLKKIIPQDLLQTFIPDIYMPLNGTYLILKTNSWDCEHFELVCYICTNLELPFSCREYEGLCYWAQVSQCHYKHILSVEKPKTAIRTEDKKRLSRLQFSLCHPKSTPIAPAWYMHTVGLSCAHLQRFLFLHTCGPISYSFFIFSAYPTMLI